MLSKPALTSTSRSQNRSVLKELKLVFGKYTDVGNYCESIACEFFQIRKLRLATDSEWLVGTPIIVNADITHALHVMQGANCAVNIRI